MENLIFWSVIDILLLRDHHYLRQGVGWQEWGVGHVKFRTVRGGSSINLQTKREGYLIFYFCFTFKQILSELSGLRVHGLQASLRLTLHNWHFKSNKEYYVQWSSSLVLVPEEFPLLQWSTTRSSSQSLISTELLDNTSCSCLEMFVSISKLVWKKHERWFVGFYCSFYLTV